jgi:hypothetical protein
MWEKVDGIKAVWVEDINGDMVNLSHVVSIRIEGYPQTPINNDIKFSVFARCTNGERYILANGMDKKEEAISVRNDIFAGFSILLRYTVDND